MSIPRIKVNNYRALGNKFIEWSLGKTTPPSDLPGFIAQIVTPEITGELPGYIKKFELIQRTSDVLCLRLPPADLVQDTLDGIKNGNDYFLADFYAKRIQGQIADDRDFFGFRVGDYTIAHCT